MVTATCSAWTSMSPTLCPSAVSIVSLDVDEDEAFSTPEEATAAARMLDESVEATECAIAKLCGLGLPLSRCSAAVQRSPGNDIHLAATKDQSLTIAGTFKSSATGSTASGQRQ
jgi:hypothetical protein